jgi:hypothetical protein
VSEVCHEPHVVGKRDSLIQKVFQRYGGQYLKRHGVSREQRLAILNISLCRTAALGGHRRSCPHAHCGYVEIHYNSCRDRNCPLCQWTKRQKWISKQQSRRLPVPVFLWTFTLLPEISHIARQNKRQIYSLMFDASSRTLQELAADGDPGMISVLHTWSRTIIWHPHIHCMVTAGVFDGERWIPTKNPNYQFPMARVRALYRKYMLQGLHELYDRKQLSLTGDLKVLTDPHEFGAMMTKLWSTEFIVNAKPPQGRPEHAVKYLAAYTRGVAISDYRILSVENGKVTFKTRGEKTLTLGWETFIGRFLLHVLPSGFKKVRHYGLYSNSSRAKREAARQAILAAYPELTKDEPDPTTAVLAAKTWEDEIAILTGKDPRICPRCKRLGIVITELGRRPPTSAFLDEDWTEDDTLCEEHWWEQDTS